VRASHRDSPRRAPRPTRAPTTLTLDLITQEKKKTGEKVVRRARSGRTPEGYIWICESENSRNCRVSTTGRGLAYYLGFKSSSSGTGTEYIVGSGVVSLNPETYILISIDPLDRVDEAGANGTGGGDRVFAKVPITVNSFDVAMYDKQLTCNAILPPVAKLDKMRVRMRFHGSSSLIDFNGADHSLTIELQCSQTR